jgi:tRNA-splicing ligase RtcB (3'-phosphate/5'-hydroxy nucleic acid ligase)
MEKVDSSESKPIKMWLNNVEEGAMQQARNLANLPFIFRHVALMGDTHQGYGMPIGGVVATRKVVIPNAVGVDISCGVQAVKTSLESLDQETIKKIFGGSKKHKGGIRSKVPVGFSHHSKKQGEEWLPRIGLGELLPIVFQQYESARKQIGTLGGNNHFIELQKGNDGFVWIMIHSGSRNLGFKVAEHYNKLAINLNERWHSVVPKKWQLAFLPIDSQEGQAYLDEMSYCVKFAHMNRILMMQRIKESIDEICSNIDYSTPIDISHNFAAMENHFGKNVMVHRKGATRARKGQFGLIPGSQGSASYVIEGLGNPESFQSCSHGAGRRMSRTKAKNELDLAAEIKHMDDLGIVHGMRHQKNLDEAVGAYKDIDKVMALQQDLVEIKVRLMPLAVIKG